MAGAVDLFAGSKSPTGANLFTVDKNPLNQLFEGVDDVIGKQAGNLGANMVTGVIQYVQKIAGAIIDAILGLPLELLSSIEPALLGAFQNVDKFFTNILGFLGGIDPLSELFSIETAAENFVNNVLAGTGLLPILDEVGHIGQEVLQPLIDAIAQSFGLPTGLSFSDLETELASYIETALTGAIQQIIDILNSIFNPGAVAGQAVASLQDSLGWVTDALNTAATNASIAVTDVEAIISSAGIGGAQALGNAIAATEMGLQSLIASSVGSGGSGFPWTFPMEFGVGSGFPWAFPVSFGDVNKSVDDVGSAILAANQAAQQVVNTLVQAVTGVQSTVDHSLQDLHTALQQLASAPALVAQINQAVATAQQVLEIIENSLQADAAAVGAALSTAATNALNAVNTGIQIIQQGSAALGVPALTNDINGFVTALESVPTNLQILGTAVYQGIASIFGWVAPPAPSSAQVQSASAQSANVANSASTIAQSISSTIAARSVSNPASWGIDQSASASFDIASMNGTTGPTINVTASTPAACYIDTPDGGIKKAVAWLGDGTLTGINAMYINLYSVNTATKVSTWVWSSNNIIGAVSGGAIPLWNYANIPSPYITTTQGNKWVAEIQVLGTGTYKIIGISGHWLNPNTAVTVGALGGTRTPATKQASVSSQTAGDVKAPSWTLTTVTGDNCIVVDLVAQSNTSAITALSVTCGGVAMTQKAFTADWDTGAEWAYTAQFELHNALFAAFSAGAQTIAVTTTGGGTSGTQCAVYGNASSYQNISAVSSATTATGTTSNPSQTVTGLTANSATITHSVLGSDIAPFSAGNQNLIANISGARASMIAQDQLSYATSVPFTGTNGTAGGWGGSVVTLTSTLTTPLQVPASTSTFTDSNNIPWMALTGSAGVSQLAAQTKVFATAGTKTYTVPANVQAAAAAGATIKFDIVLIGDGGGGTFSTGPGGDEHGGRAGTWTGITLTYTNAGGGIPLTTTTFSITLGAGGAAGDSGTPTGTGGTGCSCTITGYGTISATAGGGGGSGASVPSNGESPGDFTFNSATYNGGLESTPTGAGGRGSSPGGGGACGAYYFGAAQSGAPAGAFITAYQV